MTITIRNTAKVPNKYIRFVKWKLYSLQEKFDQLIYAEVHVNMEGKKPAQYKVSVKLGIPGRDIFVSHKSEKMKTIMLKLSQDIHRSLATRSQRRATSI